MSYERPPRGIGGPYATHVGGVWRTHPTVSAASQYLRRHLDAAEQSSGIVWRWRNDPQRVALDGGVAEGFERRPYGRRSGRSELPRLDVRVPTAMLAAIERARGISQDRSSWVRAAIQQALDTEQPFRACKNWALKRGGI